MLAAGPQPRRRKPEYFDGIAASARRRWDQLDSDPDLSGPWHVLFKQVLRPRFVLAELLQNADDAGAGEASARLAGDVFEFSHDGEDFDASTLSALCSFGRSSKRRVHSIGLWGIGFKSVFSLGPVVEVLTPTLAFRFREARFTEPEWLADAQPADRTIVRVRLRQSDLRERMVGEIERWRQSPIALLFLRSLRKLALEGHVIQLADRGPGPALGSRWFDLGHQGGKPALVVRSEPLEVPPEVVNEIRQLRHDASLDVPPLAVDVALDAKHAGRVFCVLPTDFRVEVPFAINAPFVLEPGRESPADPAVSPTNAWLLREVSRLVAATLQNWLGNRDLRIEQRAQAYSLLPRPDGPSGQELGARVTGALVTGIREDLLDRALVLCADGDVRPGNGALDAPAELMSVWTPEQVSSLAGFGGLVPVASVVAPRVRDVLAKLGGLRRFGRADVLGWLASDRPVPRPATLDAVKALWAYIAAETVESQRLDRLAIIPVEGEAVLLPYERVSVVRLTADLDADLASLFKLRPFIDQDFLMLCEEAAAKGRAVGGMRSWQDVATALVVGHAYAPRVIDLKRALGGLAHSVRERGTKDEVLTFVRVAWRHDVGLPAEAPLLCADGNVRTPTSTYADLDGVADALVPDALRPSVRIADDHFSGLHASERQRFFEWLRRGGVEGFPPPARQAHRVYGRAKLEEFIRERGGTVPQAYPLQRGTFLVEDWDYPKEYWDHWSGIAHDDASVWPRLLRLVAPCGFASPWVARPTVYQSGYSVEHQVPCGQPVAGWVKRLAGYPCVPTEGGGSCLPGEAYRRTEKTRHLEGQVPFLASDLDVADLSAFWDWLGVRHELTDARPMFSLLRGLRDRPLEEVLVHVANVLGSLAVQSLGPEVWASVRQTFQEEALVPCDDGTWQSLGGLVVENPDHLPGCPAVHPSLRHLEVWRYLKVPGRPSREVVIAWASELADGPLGKAEVTRVRQALGAFGTDIMATTDHWLSVNERWEPVSGFRYVAREPVPFKLFRWVASTVAATDMLRASLPPGQLGSLPDISTDVESRVTVAGVRSIGQPAWVRPAVGLLGTIELSERDVAVLARLGSAQWSHADGITVTPYVDGTPAGVGQPQRVAWDEATNRVSIIGDSATCAAEAVRILAARFQSQVVKDALRQCYDRPADWVERYLKGTPELGVREGVVSSAPDRPRVDPPLQLGLRASAEVTREPIRDADRVDASVPVGAHQRVEAGQRLQPIVRAFLRSRGLEVDDAGTVVDADGQAVFYLLEGGLLTMLDQGGGVACRALIVEEDAWRTLVVPAGEWQLVVLLGERGWIVCGDGKNALIAHPDAFEVFPATYRLRYRDGTGGSEPGAGSTAEPPA